MDLEIGVEHVGLARQERFDLEALRFLLHRGDGRFAFGDGGGVILHLAKLDQRQRVVEFPFETGDALDLGFEPRALTHQLLRGFGIVPEIRPLREGVQFGETALSDIPVKDASSAVRSTAWRYRVASEFRGAWRVSETSGRDGWSAVEIGGKPWL